MPFEIYLRVFDLNNSLLYVLVISSLGVYGLFLSGWASNSKYALMGALRSISQMISYEVSISLIIILIVLFGGSLNLNTIIYNQKEIIWFIFPLFPLAIFSIFKKEGCFAYNLKEKETDLYILSSDDVLIEAERLLFYYRKINICLILFHLFLIMI